MKVLLAIPHVFAPKAKSLYSSQVEGKREVKEGTLRSNSWKLEQA